MKNIYFYIIVLFSIYAIFFVYTPKWYHMVFKGEEYNYLYKTYEPVEEYNTEYVIDRTAKYLFLVVWSLGVLFVGILITLSADGIINEIFDLIFRRK